MVDPIQQQQMLQLQQLQQQQAQGQQVWNNVAGLVGSALAKRNDGKNDSIGNGIRYTNDGGKGAFNENQINDLKAFSQNGMDTSQKYGSLANQKFTINGQQFQADKDGLLSPIMQQPQNNSIVGIGNEGLSANIPLVPDGAASIGLGANDSAFEKGRKWAENGIVIQ